MSTLKEMVEAIAMDLTDPPYDKWNEGRNIDLDGEFTAMDYLSRCLDITYTADSRKNFLGARLLMSFGGPNIWIDTEKRVVEGAWWDERFTATYTDTLGIEDALKEYWSCF